MQLPITKKTLNYITNSAGGLAGIPQILSGLGVSNLSSLPVDHGTQYSFFFSLSDFSPEKIALGIGTLVVGYVIGKDAK